MDKMCELKSAKQAFGKAEALFKEAKYVEADEMLGDVGMVYKRLEEWGEYIRVQGCRVYVCLKLFRFDEASALLKENETVARERMGCDEIALAHVHRLVLLSTVCRDAHMQTRSFGESEERLCREVLSIYGRDGKANGRFISEIYYIMGGNFINRRQIGQGIGCFDKSMEAFGDGEPSCWFGKSTILHSLGWACIMVRKLDRALGCFKQSLAINLKNLGGEHPEIAKCYGGIGYYFSVNRDFDQALGYYQRAVNILEGFFECERIDISENYYNMAVAYREKGDKAASMRYYARSLELLEKMYDGPHPYMGVVYFDMGTHYRQEGEAGRAVEMYKKALEIYDGTYGMMHLNTAIAYNSIGYVYARNLQDYKKALSYYLKAIGIYREIFGETHDRIARTYRNIGQAYCGLGDFGKAFPYFQKAIDVLRHMGNGQSSTESNFLNLLHSAISEKAHAHYTLYEKTENAEHLRAAFETYSSTLGLVGQIRANYKAEGSKLLLSKNLVNGRFYDNALQTSFAFDKKAAFDFCEQSKAVLLLSNLKETEAKAAASIPAELLEKERQLKIELNHLDKQIAAQQAKGDEKNEKLIAKFQSEHFDFKQAYDQLIEQLEREYPEYHQLKYGTETASVSDIQQQLPDGGVMVSYYLGGDNYYIFAIAEDQCETFQLSKPDGLEEKVAAFTQAIDRHDRVRFMQTGWQLYQWLVAPIADMLLDPFEERAAKPVVIIPHGILNYLPFEALVCEPAPDDAQYGQLPYLLHQCAISYHYSATLWLHGIKKNASKAQLPDSFAGFAPVYAPPGDTSGKADGSLAVSAGNMRSWAVRSASLQDDGWKPLPHSKTEVNQVRRLFEGKNCPVHTFLYRQASKGNFLREAAAAKYLLVAAHGLVNDEHPSLSGLVFYPDGGGETAGSPGRLVSGEGCRSAESGADNGNEDGVLSMEEAYLLNLQADLVVLSSCESGIGKLAAGEGMMAVNRGFLYAGAANIVFTLFKVYDEPSSELVRLLFEHVLGGQPYARALQNAKLDFQQGGYTDPKLWASYLLVGK